MIAMTTHNTVQELAALDDTAQAVASALRAAVSTLENERTGVQTRLDMVQLDSDFVAAAGARERLRRLDEALQAQTARRDAAIKRADETAGDLRAARVELTSAEQRLVELRAATTGPVVVMRIMDWRAAIALYQSIIERRGGSLDVLPSLPPEQENGTKWQETARSTPVAPPELVS